MDTRWMPRRLLWVCMGLVLLGGPTGCKCNPQEETAPPSVTAPVASPAPAPVPAPASAPAPKVKAAAVTIVQETQGVWVRNFNPLLAPGAARWPTRAGIYEPLLIFNTLKGEFVPWLATKYEWSEGNKKLTFSTRPGVKWSDGQPFTARDVVFTFELLRKHKALDPSGVWAFLAGVQARDDATVEFTLSRPYVPGLLPLAHQPIVPEHTWKEVADPVTFTNEAPVATGPFTEVKVFQNQIFELGRNPNYWQPGKPAVPSLRFLAYPSNDQAILALLNGEVDWAGSFVPDIERLFVSKDPENHHYWFPLVGPTVMLYANTAKKPFGDVRVRKALSMAIDRDQLVKVALYGYSRPADATGLGDAHEKWRNPQALEAGDWVKFDLEKANALLDEAGYKRGKDGVRVGPDKVPLRFDIHLVMGRSDQVRTVHFIAQNLKAVGIAASPKAQDVSAFLERLQKGDFTLSIGWTSEGPSPFHAYRDLMGSEGRRGPRFQSKEADALLKPFELTTDAAEQKKLSDQLQELFASQAPALPLFPEPAWGEFNTRRFTGFPDKDHPYASPTPNGPPESLLVLTELKPR